MPIPSPQVAAQRWVAGATAKVQNYVDGVATTQKDQAGLAIAQAQKAQLNYAQAITSGLWARHLAAVGTSGWKAAVAAKGATMYSAGVTAAQSKYEQKIAPVLAFEATLQSQIDAMPRVTLQDSIARAAAWINGMHQWKLTQG